MESKFPKLIWCSTFKLCINRSHALNVIELFKVRFHSDVTRWTFIQVKIHQDQKNVIFVLFVQKITITTSSWKITFGLSTTRSETQNAQSAINVWCKFDVYKVTTNLNLFFRFLPSRHKETYWARTWWEFFCCLISKPLRNHIIGEKNISCATCGKKYTCIENLRLHQRYHLPPAYVCSYPDCNKKFHQKVLWEHHEKKHTDVKPYNCEQENCQQSFYSLRDLKRHQSRVHEKTTRKCFLCEMQFTRKDKYRLHLLKKHNELSDLDRESILDQVRTMKWNES